MIIKEIKGQVKGTMKIETYQYYTNIILTASMPFLTFKSKFSNDLATIFNRCLYIFVILYLLLKGIKARAKQETLKDLTKLSYFKIYKRAVNYYLFLQREQKQIKTQ